MTLYQHYMHWRSLGYCALLAYVHVTNRRPEIPLVHYPDPRRPMMRRHWQRSIDWAHAVANAPGQPQPPSRR